MKFVVWTYPFFEKSAGISALHRLCHWLTVLGVDASVTTPDLNRDWETKSWDGVMTPDTIAIYPEVVPDNPLKAPKIVRWVLSYPGHHYHGSPTTLGPCDLLTYYAERFHQGAVDACPNTRSQRLFVSVYPADMFFPSNLPKLHSMYYIGRGQGTFNQWQSVVDLHDVVKFPGGFPNRYEVGKVLRRVDKFYCFDQVSAIFAEAALCGATPVLIREDGSVKQCGPADEEVMGVFGSHARFDQSGDVAALINTMEGL